METFTPPKTMVKDDLFSEKRAKALSHLSISDIDPPIRDIIEDIKGIRHCFTLQSCHGHIIKEIPGGDQVKRINPEKGLPDNGVFQIAYLVLVLENSAPGRKWYQGLAGMPLLDDDFIQFGSADWFWNTQGHLNSYVIQVVPHRSRYFDRFNMDCGKARKWLNARKIFFKELRGLVLSHQ